MTAVAATRRLHHNDYFDRLEAVVATRFKVCFHRFTGADPKPEMHDHPWPWMVSLILRGAYQEEIGTGPDVVLSRRWLRPGRLNVKFQGTYHRVSQVVGPTWTVVLTPRSAG